MRSGTEGLPNTDRVTLMFLRWGTDDLETGLNPESPDKLIFLKGTYPKVRYQSEQWRHIFTNAGELLELFWSEVNT